MRPKPQADKFARLLCWSAGHARTRSYSQPAPQQRRQIKSPGVKNPAIASRTIVHHRLRSARLQSPPPHAAPKSP